jgi:prepilin-type N-terminal cleavage/methylation domain-containing protein
MLRRLRERDERGFTLAELLVAITILGIIMAAIGAMITTAFRTTTIVSNRLDASRAPKLVSFYWVPDVEGADIITKDAGGCGTGGTPLVTFTWQKYPSVAGTDAPDPKQGATEVRATWAVIRNGARTQVVRSQCDSGPVPTRTATVVPDVASGSDVTVNGDDKPRYRIEADKLFHFSVAGVQEVSS